MRNPNGYGSVVKLSGHRRRPYCARRTAGWTDQGYPIYQVIGYYATRQEGLIALAEYNRSPYDLDLARVTLAELYDRWLAIEGPKMQRSVYYSTRSAYSHMAALYNAPYKTIKPYMMQACVDGCEHGPATQAAIKALFAKLDRYALELEIIQRPASDLVKTAPKPETTRVPFTEDEIATLWDHAGDRNMDLPLILIYTGWRIGELINMPFEGLHMDGQYLVGGSKTKAGRDRIVPIHPRIMPLVAARAEYAARYHADNLITDFEAYPYTMPRLYKVWGRLMASVGMQHTPHECRHTFRSRLDTAGANKVCIDMMMGHASRDVGERVYTHKTVEELRRALLLVT